MVRHFCLQVQKGHSAHHHGGSWAVPYSLERTVQVCTFGRVFVGVRRVGGKDTELFYKCLLVILNISQPHLLN